MYKKREKKGIHIDLYVCIDTFELLFIDSFVVLMIFILFEGFLEIRSMLLRTPEQERNNQDR